MKANKVSDESRKIITPKRFQITLLWLNIIALFAIIYDLGFDKDDFIHFLIKWLYFITLIIGIVSLIYQYALPSIRPKRKVWIYDVFLLILLLAAIFINSTTAVFFTFRSPMVIYIALFFLFIREFSNFDLKLKRRHIPPSLLFILSFIFIILTGTLLLLLPHSTHTGISFIDALFTSTSAVCVTGLAVVDTGKYFTLFGQVIIMVLIQAGGLGIMTFTSYFAYFFRGSASYEAQLIMNDMTNADKMAEVFSILKKIILITFSIETAGAIIIYSTLDTNLIPSVGDRAFFSAFHAISSFCNAGFSTLTNNLYETGFGYNYSLHLTIAFLIIIGGLGFPIVFNFLKYIKHLFINRLVPVSKKQHMVYVPWVITINTRIVILTSFILLTAGTLLILVFEYNNTLAGHSGFGKVVEAFFTSTTPRTAGFNTIDITSINSTTIMIIVFLMWIGASPSSTGGGIKTSTFAISVLNIISLARGKDRIELFHREVSEKSVRRASSIVLLSMMVIAVSSMIITLFEPEKSLVSIVFETVSAYGTVGLSLGITGSLSDWSKLIIVFTMFIGRVNMLTILIALMRKVKYLGYRYPTEEIQIN